MPGVRPDPVTRGHAVVIGGSMAGLLATRVLARHFAKVTLIERDHLPDGAEHRKGVPQGRHFHILLKRGERALTQLFPDLGAARYPERYLVVGDAMCSFNAVYGQGMTVSALEAQALDACLSDQNGTEMRDLAPRFFRAAARAIDPAWLLTTSEDLRHPGAGGARPATLRLLNWYTGCIFRAAARDA